MILSAREGYRRWASTYDDAPNPIVSLVNRSLDPGPTFGKVVIDVACGTGRRARAMGAIGVDLSFEMLARVDGRFAQADARRLPFANGVADLVWCTLALGYISPIGEVMRELSRIARVGATLLAADVHPRAISAGWKRSFRDGEDVYEVENHSYSLDELTADELVLEDARDLYFGEPERAIYANAGKSELFEQASKIPAAWIRKWTRR